MPPPQHQHQHPASGMSYRDAAAPPESSSGTVVSDYNTDWNPEMDDEGFTDWFHFVHITAPPSDLDLWFRWSEAHDTWVSPASLPVAFTMAFTDPVWTITNVQTGQVVGYIEPQPE